MKSRKNFFTFLLIMIVGITISAFATGEQEFSEGSKLVNNEWISEGASFSKVSNDYVDATVYTYVPSKLYSPAPMMTPVIFVYPDTPFTGIGDAWDTLCRMGLLEIAEAERAGIMMVNPVGRSWSVADDAVHAQLLSVLFPGRGKTPVLPYISYCDMMYAIGEGSGATVINEYLTRENRANMLSGVLTFGGEMTHNVTAANDTVALPAYLVGASKAAVDFYKAINTTDTAKQTYPKSMYFNSTYTTKKVMVSSLNNTSFDKEIIADAWDSLFRRTCRNCITTSAVWKDGPAYMAEREGMYLMDRPIVKELGLTMNAELQDPVVSFQSRWYEWVPDEVYDTMADSADNTVYPLVILYHGGGDHPVFEAEQDGWVQVAAKERVILISPEDNNNQEDNLDLINFIIEKYPVDVSRTYINGFSLGSQNARLTATKFIDVFAALALLSPPKDLGQTIEYEASGWNADEIDLPLWLSTGTNESGKPDPNNPNAPLYFSAYRLVNDAQELNNMDDLIDGDAIDLEEYGYVGYDNSENTTDYINKFGIPMSDTVFYNDDNVPMVAYTLIENGFHNHWTGLAEMAWDFMGKFSRDPITKEIKYTATTDN